MGRVGEQNKVSVSMLLLIYLKKKTIHDAVCNKICAPHVIYPDARAAGKRFYIEASVRDIEKIFGMRPQPSMHGAALDLTQTKPVEPKR